MSEPAIQLLKCGGSRIELSLVEGEKDYVQHQQSRGGLVHVSCGIVGLASYSASPGPAHTPTKQAARTKGSKDKRQQQACQQARRITPASQLTAHKRGQGPYSHDRPAQTAPECAASPKGQSRPRPGDRSHRNHPFMRMNDYLSAITARLATVQPCSTSSSFVNGWVVASAPSPRWARSKRSAKPAASRATSELGVELTDLPPWMAASSIYRALESFRRNSHGRGTPRPLAPPQDWRIDWEP